MPVEIRKLVSFDSVISLQFLFKVRGYSAFALLALSHFIVIYVLNLFLDHEASKVHFSTDVSLNTEINIVCKNNEEIDVHIGLLQEHHTYEIQFQVPNRFPDGWKHPEVLDSEFRILSIDSIGK